MSALLKRHFILSHKLRIARGQCSSASVKTVLIRASFLQRPD